MTDRRYLISPIRLPVKRNASAIPIDRFTCPVPEEFLCSICMKLSKNQMECHECGSLYCHGCTLRLPRSKERLQGSICCICDATVRLQQPSRVLKKIIGKLTLTCKHKNCREVISLDNLYDHQTFCQFREVPCGNSRLCNNKGLISAFFKVPNHPHGVFACSASCKGMIEFSAIVQKRDKKQALTTYKKLLEANEQLKLKSE